MKRPVMSEQEMAAVVVKRLREDGFDVYEEVSIPGCVGEVTPRADIVALKDSRLWVIEAKKALTFELLAQAIGWIEYSAAVFIAVPAPAPGKKVRAGRKLAHRMLKMLGIGMIEVKSLWPTDREEPLDWTLAPQHRTSYSSALRDALRPEHQTHARAGSAEGGHFTQYRETCERIAAYVRENPGQPLADVVRVVPHHYASHESALVSLTTWGKNGRVHGVELRKEHGVVRAYPAEAS